MTNKKPVASTITVQVTPDLLDAITLIASTVPGVIKPTRHAVGRIALSIGLDDLRRDPSLIVPFLTSVSP